MHLPNIARITIPVGLGLASALFVALWGTDASGGHRRRPVAQRSPAPIAHAAPAPAAPNQAANQAPQVDVSKCREQLAQPFLIRSNWFGGSTPEQVKKGRDLFEQAVHYRTEKYGYFPGFGKSEWNPHAPGSFAVATTFMGLPITVHKKIVPALKCVEKAMKDGPAHLDYKPGGIGGIRFHNTYRGGEVSNHVYGIAIDIDSEKNTCCGCVGAWSQHPLCKKKVSSVYERMAMPHSWVATFERFGFYWLGHDAMQDTMHFEFLGDPDKSLAP